MSYCEHGLARLTPHSQACCNPHYRIAPHCHYLRRCIAHRNSLLITNMLKRVLDSEASAASGEKVKKAKQAAKGKETADAVPVEATALAAVEPTRNKEKVGASRTCPDHAPCVTVSWTACFPSLLHPPAMAQSKHCLPFFPAPCRC